MNTSIIIAAVSGSGLINVFITLVVAGLICWLLWWLLTYLGLPEPFAKIARAIVAIVAVAFVIDALLKATGHGGFINW